MANAAIVPAGSGGGVSVYVTNQTDVILDIDGYFESPGGANAYSFYPATPCRVTDTRGATGQFGGPSMFPGQSRDFPIPVQPLRDSGHGDRLLAQCHRGSGHGLSRLSDGLAERAARPTFPR